MRWPWQSAPVETRQRSSYEETLVAILAAQAGGTNIATPAATAAVETAAGLIGRAFSVAKVTGREAAIASLTPAMLNMIARAVVRRGEFVGYLAMNDRGVRIAPANSHDVRGPEDPASWTYRLTLTGPHTQQTMTHVPASNIVHFIYARDPENPWLGYGPLQVASNSGALSGNTILALAHEASGDVAQILPIPGAQDDADGGTIETLLTDLSGANGKTAIVEDAADSFGTGAPSVANANWTPRRLGAAPPVALVQLAKQATEEILAAFGLPQGLYAASDGTSAREGLRQFLHTTIQPLAVLIQTELREKIDPSITLDFEALMAADIQGRARAFQSLMGGGMEITKAAAVSGILMPGEDD